MVMSAEEALAILRKETKELKIPRGMKDSPYADFCRRQHRIIGHYLAVQAWVRRLDCIVLVRSDLEVLLGLRQFKSVRIESLIDDFEPWFPFHKAYYNSRAPSSIGSLFLARVPIAEYLSGGTMTTEKRIVAMRPGAPRTERFSKSDDGSDVPTESDMVTCLSLLAAGLPPPTRRRRKK